MMDWPSLAMGGVTPLPAKMDMIDTIDLSLSSLAVYRSCSYIQNVAIYYILYFNNLW